MWKPLVGSAWNALEMLFWASLPWAVYSTFAMEEKGESQQIWKLEKKAGARAIGPKPKTLAFPLYNHSVRSA